MLNKDQAAVEGNQQNKHDHLQLSLLADQGAGAEDRQVHPTLGFDIHHNNVHAVMLAHCSGTFGRSFELRCCIILVSKPVSVTGVHCCRLQSYTAHGG